ncbi:hypothetical protein ACFQNE_07245, partial [Gordonia phosphorivorans]
TPTPPTNSALNQHQRRIAALHHYSGLDLGIWLVAEEFVDQAAFEAHQQRVAASAWGHATAAIRRDYTIS